MDQLTMAILIWIAFIILFVAIELATATLITIWFAAGALAALIVSFFAKPFVWQVFTFALVSLVTIIVLRPCVLRKMIGHTTKTNVDMLIGQRALVLSRIGTFSDGQVKVSGQIWTAFCPEGDVAEGEEVLVQKVQGVRLMVKKVSKP